jgi:hypothetical protein
MTRCKPFSSRRCRLRGFAYLWVLLLVAFMGVGLMLGIDVYLTEMQREKERELLFIGHQFRTAISRYQQGKPPGMAPPARGEYPKRLEDLLDDKRFGGTTRHLRKIFVDPLTGKDEWGLVMIGDRIVGVHSLSNATPIKQANFEPDDLSFAGKAEIREWAFTFPFDLRIESESAPPSPLLPAPAAGASGAASAPVPQSRPNDVR